MSQREKIRNGEDLRKIDMHKLIWNTFRERKK